MEILWNSFCYFPLWFGFLIPGFVLKITLFKKDWKSLLFYFVLDIGHVSFIHVIKQWLCCLEFAFCCFSWGFSCRLAFEGWTISVFQTFWDVGFVLEWFPSPGFLPSGIFLSYELVFLLVDSEEFISLIIAGICFESWCYRISNNFYKYSFWLG